MAEQVKNYITNALKSEKNMKVVTVIGLGIIGLIFALTMLPTQTDEAIAQSENSTDEYIEQIEVKVSQILSSIEGVGQAKVMITVKNSSQTVYQTENKTATDTKIDENGNEDKSHQSEESLVIVDGVSGNNQALVKTEIPPQIGGIAIICQGGDDVTVVNQITQTLTAIFEISSTNISVAKLANNNLSGGE